MINDDFWLSDLWNFPLTSSSFDRSLGLPMTSCGKRNRGQGRLDSLRAIRVVARHLLSLARRKTETNGCLKTPKAISPPWKVQRLEVIAHSPSLLPKNFLISPWRSREFGSAVVDSQRPTSATQCGSPASRRSKDTVCYRMFVCNSPCSCAFRCMSGHKHTQFVHMFARKMSPFFELIRRYDMLQRIDGIDHCAISNPGVQVLLFVSIMCL